MNIEVSNISVEEDALQSLEHWLHYGKHSWLMTGGAIYIPYSLVFLGLTILALLFFPYMLWKLYKAQWYKSMWVLLGVVGLPYLLTSFLNLEPGALRYTIQIIPLMNFYLFAYALSYLIGERLIELQTIRKWEKGE